MRKILSFTLAAAALLAQDRPIVLKTATLYDGKGKTLHNTIVVVEGAKIVRIGGAAPANAIGYDLTALTVTPGWIDTHSHLAYHFDNNDRYGAGDEPPSQANWHIAEKRRGHSERWLHHHSKSGCAAGQRPARRDRARGYSWAANSDFASANHQSKLGCGEDEGDRARAQAAGRGFHQAIRV
jgi:hypothetical protein